MRGLTANENFVLWLAHQATPHEMNAEEQAAADSLVKLGLAFKESLPNTNRYLLKPTARAGLALRVDAFMTGKAS